MALDQPPHDVQPKACAFAHGLCRKERIEDAIADFRWYTLPIIYDLDHHSIALAFGSDFNLAALVHGIQRVIDKVRPDLIEFSTQPVHGWKILFDIQTHSYGLALRF